MTAAQLAIPTTTVESSAIISPDGVYRYVLTRRWSPGRAVLFVMLNPSTADAAKDDPTIRRCIKHAKALGGGALAVVNLYALRSVSPKLLGEHVDPVGTDNARHIAKQAAEAGWIVCAWGTSPFVALAEETSPTSFCRRDVVVLRLLRALAPITPFYKLAGADGVGPLHPLARVAGLKPQPWDGRR